MTKKSEKSYQGRAIIPGKIKGEALVSRSGFNTLANFYPDILNNHEKAYGHDKTNPEIYGKLLTNKILCLPETIGSTSAGSTWEIAINRGISPKALLFSNGIDSLAASGIALASIWLGKHLITVDHLGDDFLNEVQTGQIIEIDIMGIVRVL